MKCGLYIRDAGPDGPSGGGLVASLRGFARDRGWRVVVEAVDAGAGDDGRRAVLESARGGRIDCVVVRRLDHWGDSLAGLVAGLGELAAHGVGLVAIEDGLDLADGGAQSLVGRLAGLARSDAERRSRRVKVGIAEARRRGTPIGRPRTSDAHAERARLLYRETGSKSEVARRLGLPRTTVRRLLADEGGP